MKCRPPYCNRPRAIIKCPACRKPIRTASRCRKCLNASANRNKSAPHQKRGYCDKCRKLHRREWDTAYKRKQWRENKKGVKKKKK